MKRFRPVTWLLLGFIKAWRAMISPLYGNVCKYHPSCSAYGLRAVDVHGAFKGSGLIVWRLLRCNPWSAGGYDPVPGTPEAAQWKAEQGINDQRKTGRPEADPATAPDPSTAQPEVTL